jgi:hypothetical protein
MNSRDPHQSLKSEILGKKTSGTTDFILAKLQWGKDDIAFSLHVSPRSFNLSGGYQATDFLSHLGFERSGCPFVDSRNCYVRWVDENFDLESFPVFFDQALRNLLEAQGDLEKCGFFFEKPEGVGFFLGRQSADRRYDFEMSGDGHTAMSVKKMKESEDDFF